MRNRTCPSCRGPIVRLDAYDAYACRKCDHWFSKPCTDERGVCSYCDELRKLKKPSDAPPEVWDDPVTGAVAR
jgi:hypothetical protein